jgi:predicted RNA binding protein YcfA (HicA-like mRNA interferase family)
MSVMPVVTSRVMICFLRHLGFYEARQKGSHKFFRHPDGRTATVPVHHGETLGRGITAKILKDVEATVQDFLTWYHKKP